MIGKADHYIVA